MASTSKRERQVAAAVAAEERVLHRVYSLSLALMRADAALTAGTAEWKQVVASGMSDEELASRALIQVQHLTNDANMRADALLSFHLAALYAVVEKWTAWKFADSGVDALLQGSSHVDALKRFRHSVFHAEAYDVNGAPLFTAVDQMVDWSRTLAAALRSALHRWHSDTGTCMAEYLSRVGY